jgi:MFS transporter, AAHS family, 4-hydroxybenzoate transporter
MAERQTTDISEIIEKQKLTGFVVRLILLCWIVTFFDGFDMNVIAFVMPDLSSLLHLNPVMKGYVFSAGLLGTMIGGFFFGYLGDRIGRRPSIILATASFGVLTLGLVLPHTYGQLLGLRLIQGIAIGGLLPLCWVLNIEYVPRRYRSTVVTVIMLGYTIGNSFSAPFTVWMVPRHGWQSVFIFGGCAALLATGLLILFLPESIRYLVAKNKRPEVVARIVQRLAPARRVDPADQFVVSDETARGGEGFSVSMLFRDELRWITPLLWIAYMASSVAVFFGNTWGPTVLQTLGFSRSTAALAVGVNSMGGALGGLLLMRFTDTRGAISIAVLPVVSVPILLTLGLTNLAGSAFLVLNFFSTMFIVGTHFGMHSIAGIFYPSSYRANGAGWATSVAKVGSIIGPLIPGMVLSSRLPVKAIFTIFAVCPCIVGISIVSIGVLQRRMSRNGTALQRAHSGPLAAEATPPE